MKRIILIIVTLACSGCGAINRQSAPWKVTVAAGPLSGSGEVATLESREYWSGIMAAVVSSDTRFRTTDGRMVDASHVGSEIVSFLEKRGHLAKWPDTRFAINGRRQKLAPYKIYLVSILPSVVVLVPHDYGDIQGRSIVGIVGWAPPESLHNDRIVNHIIFGPTVESTGALLWFSPDLKKDIEPIAESDADIFTIEKNDLSLIGRRNGATIRFERK